MSQTRKHPSSIEISEEALHALNQANEAAITTFIHPLQETPPTLASTLTDTSSIHARVHDISILILHLCKYRASLRRDLNSCGSAISRLPPETLSRIFQHVCDPGFGGSWVPTKIGAIYSYWRQIAWRTPQIWTSLVIGSRFWKSQQFDILDLYYKNMRGLLIDLTILRSPPDSHKGPRGIPAEEAFKKIFIENGSKLNTLTFKDLPISWLPHLEKATKVKGLPNLTSLMVSDCWVQPFPKFSLPFRASLPIAIHNVPRLEKLALERIINTSLSFPWIQITNLRLYQIDSGRALEVVLQCPNLKFLKCETLTCGPAEITPPLDKEVTLNHLEALEYNGRYLSPAWETVLTTRLRFTSSLKQLTWAVKPGIFGTHKEFLLRLPTSIVYIRLVYDQNRDSCGDLEDILIRLTSLRHLVLRFEDPMDIKVIDWLTIGDDRRSLLSLRSLGLVITNEELSDSELLRILDMTRSRWEAREEGDTFDEFTFSFPCFEKDTVKWSGEFMDRAKALVREGLPVCLLGKKGERLEEWLHKA